MSPVVFNQILKINEEKKIDQMRLSKDFFLPKINFFFKKYFYINLLKYLLLLLLSINCKKKLSENKIKFDDYCFGIIHSGYINKKLIILLKKKIKKKKIQNSDTCSSRIFR